MRPYIYYDPSITYPAIQEHFSPSQHYPEYPWHDISSKENKIYDTLRNILYEYGLDKENFGRSTWNPFKNFISPGMTVLIKPNMVMHQFDNHVSYDELITHPSIVRAIIDYIYIALNGTGKIIIADAPMQSCNFELLKRNSGYKDIETYFTNKNINIQLLDLRRIYSKFNEFNELQTFNASSDPLGYQKIDLGKFSFHATLDRDSSRFRVTNYPPSMMGTYHTKNIHSYLISNSILSADAVISIPKLKTHRKAGMTGAIKNCVGIVGDKACLPHHSFGSIEEGGDEYLYKNLFKKINTFLNEASDILNYKKCYSIVKLLRKFQNLNIKFINKYKRDNYFEGSWYGNDTISRTSLDLLRILLFSSKDGTIQKYQQRNVLFIVDGIVAGEGEGPLLPTARKAGIIAISDNAIVLDCILATLMGFDPDKIPTIANGLKYINMTKSSIFFKTNYILWKNKNIQSFEFKDTLQFKSSQGWKEKIYIEH